MQLLVVGPLKKTLSSAIIVILIVGILLTPKLFPKIMRIKTFDTLKKNFSWREGQGPIQEGGGALPLHNQICKALVISSSGSF